MNCMNCGIELNYPSDEYVVMEESEPDIWCNECYNKWLNDSDEEPEPECYCFYDNGGNWVEDEECPVHGTHWSRRSTHANRIIYGAE